MKKKRKFTLMDYIRAYVRAELNQEKIRREKEWIKQIKLMRKERDTI